MAFSTYICPIDPETSVHTLSISSLSLSSAKAWRVGSGSDKKPTRPAADVRAGIAVAVCCLSPSLTIHAVASDGCEMVAMASVAAGRESVAAAGRMGE
jgi:hypothetical protein